MQRRKLLKTAGLSAILASGTAPTVMAAPKLRWRLASSFPRQLDTIYGGAETFARAVLELSDGQFEITTNAAGELMPAFGVVDGVQQGAIEIAHTSPYYFFGKDPTWALGTAIPFGMNSRQRLAWMTQGNGGKLMAEFYDGYNIVNFPAGNTGAQMGGWYRKEIKSIADVNGLKMRIGGFGGTVFQAIGGIPQNLPGGEIYQALEKGTIDACEWVGPYDDLKLGFHKVARYYYYPGWWEGGPEFDVLINKDAFNKLSRQFQDILKYAAHFSYSDMQAKYDAKNPAALKELVAEGAQLRQFPKDFMDAAFKAAMTYYEELSASNENWRRVYEDYAAFRKDEYLWFRLAEGSFDRYMQRAPL